MADYEVRIVIGAGLAWLLKVKTVHLILLSQLTPGKSMANRQFTLRGNTLVVEIIGGYQHSIALSLKVVLFAQLIRAHLNTVVTSVPGIYVIVYMFKAAVFNVL